MLLRGTAACDAMTKRGKQTRNMALPVDREELNWKHITQLGPEEAVALLADVKEAQMVVSTLKGLVRDSMEVCVLRGVLAMAENDLLEIVDGHPHAIRVGIGPRGLFREGTPPGKATIYTPKRSGLRRGRPPSHD